MRDRNEIAEHLLELDPEDMTNVEFAPWHVLLKKGFLQEITLEPGKADNFLPLSHEKNAQLRKQWQYEYYDHPERTTKIDKPTFFWYPEGIQWIPEVPRTTTREIAGIYLPSVIPASIQAEALEGLEQMNWIPPDKNTNGKEGRPETVTAMALQQGEGRTPAGELTMGFTDIAQIEKTSALKDNVVQFEYLKYLLWTIGDCYARTLPGYFTVQNRPKPLEERLAEAEKKGSKPSPDYGGILEKHRQFCTPFSTITLLRSCPASIHTDGGNAFKEQTAFTCLTSVGRRKPDGEPDFSGGTFCLIEYGYRIAVKPGDLLIAQLTREWHCNLGVVEGTKYSVVCYFRRRRLSDATIPIGKSVTS